MVDLLRYSIDFKFRPIVSECFRVNEKKGSVAYHSCVATLCDGRGEEDDTPVWPLVW